MVCDRARTGWKEVAEIFRLFHDFLDNESGKSCKWHAMHGGAHTLLDRPDGALNLADVGVGGRGVEGDGR